MTLMPEQLHRNWKQWAAEYGAAHRALEDSKARTQAEEELKHLRAELDATLQTDPLCLGIRADTSIAAAAEEAAKAADSSTAWDLLQHHLTVRVLVSSLAAPGRLPKREWVVGSGWLPAHRAGILAGRGATGKSRLALQLACALAAGEEQWLGSGAAGRIEMNASHVVFASWEDEREDAMRRYRDMAKALPWLTDDATGDRLHWIDMSPHGPLWGPSDSGSRHIATSAELTPAGRAIRWVCQSFDARLLILDPLAAVYASDENVRGLVRHFMTNWDAWARQTRCAVMLIAHPPKSDARFSGSTDWENASRWMWTLSRQPTEKKTNGQTPIKTPQLELAKTNYGVQGQKVWLRSPEDSWAAWEQCSARHAMDSVLANVRVDTITADEDEAHFF